MNEELEMISELDPEKYYMVNTTNVKDYLLEGDYNTPIKIQSPNNKKKAEAELIITKAWCGRVAYFDLCVLDAFFTLSENGYHLVTYQMINRCLTGNLDAGLTAKREEEIRSSVIKLVNTEIKIVTKYKCYVSPLLMASGRQCARLKNGCVVWDAIAIDDDSAYIQYAKDMSWVVSADFKYLGTAGEMNDSADTIMIKHYLLQKILLFNNTKNKIKSSTISLYRWNPKVKRFVGLYSKLGYETDKSSGNIMNKSKRNTVLRIINTYLHFLTTKKLIVGYEMTKKGRYVSAVDISSQNQ